MNPESKFLLFYMKPVLKCDLWGMEWAEGGERLWRRRRRRRIGNLALLQGCEGSYGHQDCSWGFMGSSLAWEFVVCLLDEYPRNSIDKIKHNSCLFLCFQID